jgi:hypothetical protein
VFFKIPVGVLRTLSYIPAGSCKKVLPVQISKFAEAKGARFDHGRLTPHSNVLCAPQIRNLTPDHTDSTDKGQEGNI